MALIYRSICESRLPNLVDRAPSLMEDWLRWKLRPGAVELPAAGETVVSPDGNEIACAVANAPDGRSFRATLFEGRPDDQVKTTFVAIEDGERRWVWVDLDRWTETPYQPGFVPIAPGIVSTLLHEADLQKGSLRLSAAHEEVGGAQIDGLVGLLLDDSREAPVVVVTPTHAERDGEMASAVSRAKEIHRRVAGIGATYLLLPGAIGRLSRLLLEELGEGFDVHSGAVRTYVPGLGSSRDRPGRHRFVTASALMSRSNAIASQIVGRALVAASVHEAPPAAWRRTHRALLDTDRVVGDPDLEEFLQYELDQALAARDAARSEARDLSEMIEAQRQGIEELQSQKDDLAARLAYLSSVAEAARPGSSHGYVAAEDEPLDWCSDVLARAARELDLVIVHPSCAKGAAGLDEHCQSSWARRAWRGLRALQAYAAAKQNGEWTGGDFTNFCTNSGSPHSIPAGWAARHEGKITKTNDRFKRLRTLPVDPMATSDGRATIFMEAHIRVEDGDTPCPRIHFHDDTSGKTGKIHVGWFGDHLDSTAKP